MDSKDMFIVSRKPTHPGEMLLIYMERICQR